jgi:hypothetical protein
VADQSKVVLQVIVGGVAAFFAWWVSIYILPIVSDVDENTKDIRQIEKEKAEEIARLTEANRSIRRELDKMQARQDAHNHP